MPITLNNVTFDPAFTTFREDHQEIAGQDGRTIRINGIVQGLADTAAIEAAIDAVLAAASEGDISYLSVRADRQLRVRREKFTREIQRDGRVGRYELVLRAEDPFEEAINSLAAVWSISASGASKSVTSNGTAPSPMLLTLQANGTLVNPSITDGERTITYNGTLAPASVIELDGAARQARFFGSDITPSVSGDFPRIFPGVTVLHYTDDDASSHNATVSISFNERWW